jgi:hypothetical protein
MGISGMRKPQRAKVSRRTFLKSTAATAGVLAGCAVLGPTPAPTTGKEPNMGKPRQRKVTTSIEFHGACNKKTATEDVFDEIKQEMLKNSNPLTKAIDPDESLIIMWMTSGGSPSNPFQEFHDVRSVKKNQVAAKVDGIRKKLEKVKGAKDTEDLPGIDGGIICPENGGNGQ